MSNITVAVISKGEPRESYFCFEEFKRSLKDFPITWLDTSGYIDLSCRPRIFHRAIKDGTINTEYVILCDAWDLVFIDTPEQIIEKYKTFNADVVISGERNCFPADLKDEFDKLPHTSSYRYVNCGVIVGTLEGVKKMFEDMDTENIPVAHFDSDKGCWEYPNEQIEYQRCTLRQPVKIAIDYNQEITWCFHDVLPEEVGYKEGKLWNAETKTSPSIPHWNGGGKTNGTMHPILKFLNY